MSDLVATFAPVTAPLRDWLREHFTPAGTDSEGRKMVYAAGIPSEAFTQDGTGNLLRGTCVTLYTAGGTEGGTGLDRPFVRFNVMDPSALAAEAAAYALRALLSHAVPGTALGTTASPSPVRLAGADTQPPLWTPDLDAPRIARFVVTSTLTVQAVGT